MFRKIAFILSLLMVILTSLSYADSEFNINTNGSVTIDGNNVYINGDGNTPLEIFNAQVPGNANLFINSDSGNIPQFQQDFGVGPVINVVNDSPFIISASQPILIGEAAIASGANPAKSSTPASLDNHEIANVQLAPSVLSAVSENLIVNTAVSIPGEDQPLVNLQGVTHASKIVFTEKEIILQ